MISWNPLQAGKAIFVTGLIWFGNTIHVVPPLQGVSLKKVNEAKKQWEWDGWWQALVVIVTLQKHGKLEKVAYCILIVSHPQNSSWRSSVHKNWPYRGTLCKQHTNSIVGRREVEEVTATNLYREGVHMSASCNNNNNKTPWACLNHTQQPSQCLETQVRAG